MAMYAVFCALVALAMKPQSKAAVPLASITPVPVSFRVRGGTSGVSDQCEINFRLAYPDADH